MRLQAKGLQPVSYVRPFRDCLGFDLAANGGEGLTVRHSTASVRGGSCPENNSAGGGLFLTCTGGSFFSPPPRRLEARNTTIINAVFPSVLLSFLPYTT